MADIEPYLKQLASDIYPTASQLERAATSNNHLRAELQTGNMDCRIIDTSLSGSYARHTVLRPLEDVDVVVEIDPSHWSKGLLATLFNGLPKPEAVIRTFHRAIQHRYKLHGSRVFKQRRSVRLSLSHLDLDVVPAVPDPKRHEWYRIPDRDMDRWIPTAPKIHSRIATTLNDATNERFKPTVRLLKHWNARLPQTTRLKSFAIETLATRFFQKAPLQSFTDGLISFFDFVCWLGDAKHSHPWRDRCGVSFDGWAPSLPDVAETGSNLLANCKRERLAKFVVKAVRMRSVLDDALSARSTDSAIKHMEKCL